MRLLSRDVFVEKVFFPLAFIGKEANRLEDREAGLLTDRDLEEYQTVYTTPHPPAGLTPWPPSAGSTPGSSQRRPVSACDVLEASSKALSSHARGCAADSKPSLLPTTP